MTSVFWFRRDLRLQDNLALNAAVEAATDSVPGNVAAAYFFELDYFDSLLPIRQHSLIASVEALDVEMNSQLNIRVVSTAKGIAAELIAICREQSATEVHASRMFDPAGIAQQNLVGLELSAAGIYLRLTDSNYAVQPGTVRKPDGTPYKVYTPFYKAWLQIGWGEPAVLPPLEWVRVGTRQSTPKPSGDAPIEIRAGYEFALETFANFEQRALHDYDEQRNRADLSGTSHLSHALAHGEIHPRTLLARLGDSDGEIVFAKELCWREFYADVLFHNPHSLDDYYEPRFAKMRYDDLPAAKAKFEAWQQGKTGYPMVDAGMRQLASAGWMHNRVRMIVASFLVKDLHIEWQHGARHFESLLTDFDPASNSHGWQWTAGCGTDASPYYRVFNPVMQGYKFDPNGDYVRKYVPELRHIEGAAVHEPWLLSSDAAPNYPGRIVDHAAERIEALERLEELKTLN